jgi:hypothetical protein
MTIDTGRQLLVDQRSVQRRDLCAQVEVLPLDGRRPSFWARARDVSSKGIFIDSTRSPGLDTLVVLKIHIGRREPPLKVTAEVVHRIQGRGFGCRFTDTGVVTSTRLELLEDGLKVQ